MQSVFTKNRSPIDIFLYSLHNFSGGHSFKSIKWVNRKKALQKSPHQITLLTCRRALSKQQTQIATLQRLFFPSFISILISILSCVGESTEHSFQCPAQHFGAPAFERAPSRVEPIWCAPRLYRGRIHHNIPWCSFFHTRAAYVLLWATHKWMPAPRFFMHFLLKVRRDERERAQQSVCLRI